MSQASFSERADQVLCWLAIAAAVVFLVLSRGEHILKEPEYRREAFVGQGKVLPIVWKDGLATCAYCGCQVSKTNGFCARCGRGFLWTTAKCPWCEDRRNLFCPCCRGDGILGN